MWLTVLPVFASLLRIAASQSCPEDGALLVKFKPLGQCSDEDNTCLYRITLPPLTVQLPKSFSELQKMGRELKHLTQTVNQLKDDCRECHQRQRLAWNIQTPDKENGEGTQASKGTLKTRERQQDIPKGRGVVILTPGESADEDTLLSRDTKTINPTDLEKQGWNSRMNINPNTTIITDETSLGSKGSNSSQNRRKAESPSRVVKQPSTKVEKRTKASQDGEEPPHHGRSTTSGIKFGKYTSGNQTKHGRVESISENREVTKISKAEDAVPKQPPIHLINDPILGERLHEADIKEPNDRELKLHMTKHTRTHSDHLEDIEEVSDTGLKDTIAFVLDNTNVASEGSASVKQPPTLKNKDSEAGSGVDSNPVKIADRVSGLEMSRSPMSNRPKATFNVSQINSHIKESYSQNSFKPETEAGSTVEVLSVSATETVSSAYPHQINSQTMYISSESPGTETDSEEDLNPVDKESASEVEALKTTISGSADAKYDASHLNPQMPDRNSKHPFEPFTNKDTKRNKEMQIERESSPINPNDTPKPAERPRLPVSITTDDNADEGPLNSRQLISRTQNTINPTAEAEKDLGRDSNPVNSSKTQRETSSSPMPGITNSPVGVREINSKTMDNSTGKPGTYAERDDEIKLKPAETVHGLGVLNPTNSNATVDVGVKNQNRNDDLSKRWPHMRTNFNRTKLVSGSIRQSNPMTANTKTKYVLRNNKTAQLRNDKLKSNQLAANRGKVDKSRVSSVSKSAEPALESSGIPQPSGVHPVRVPVVHQESSEIPQPSGRHPMRVPVVHQESSGIPQPSGGHPVRVPVVHQESSRIPQPSGGHPVRVPVVHRESSGVPQPSGGHPVRVPVVHRESSGIPQPGGEHPVRVPVVHQESSGVPQPSGVHPVRVPVVHQESSGIPQPSGGHPVRVPVVHQESSRIPQPSGGHLVRVPVVHRESSGVPQPSGVHPVRVPVVHQESSGIPQPSGGHPVRVPVVHQESSGIPKSSGVHPVRVPVVHQESSEVPQSSGVHPGRASSVDQKSSGIPQPSRVLPFRGSAVQQKTSVMTRPKVPLPFRTPAVKQKTSSTLWPSEQLTVTAPAVNQDSNGMPRQSGVLPMRAPPVNQESSKMPQPSGSSSEKVPAVDQESSGIDQPSRLLSFGASVVKPKTRGMTRPNGMLPFRAPTVKQNADGKAQPTGVLSIRSSTVKQESSGMPYRSGLLPIRAPDVEQETSSMAWPSGILSVKDPAIKYESNGMSQPSGHLPVRAPVVEQEISGMPQPDGLLNVKAPILGQAPLRFKIQQKNITVPKQQTRPTMGRVMLATKPTQKKPYILYSTPGNESVEASPKTLASGRLKNSSRVTGHTMNRSSWIKHVHSKTPLSPQNRSKSKAYDTSPSLTHTLTEPSSRQEESEGPTTAATWFMKLMKEKQSQMTRFTSTVATPHNTDHVENAKVLDKPDHHWLDNSSQNGEFKSLSGKSSDSDRGSTNVHLDVGGSSKVTVLQPNLMDNIQNKEMDPKHGPSAMVQDNTGSNVSKSPSDSILDQHRIKTPNPAESVEVYSGDGQAKDENDRKFYPLAKGRTEEKEENLYGLSSEGTDAENSRKPLAVESVDTEGLEKQLVSTCKETCDRGSSPQPDLNIHKSSGDQKDKPAHDCSDFTARNLSSGVYNVTGFENCTFSVACDMKVSGGGGWTLIQRRFDGSISFNRNWDEYKKGFGNLSGEFWLGNDKIHWLTSAKAMALRVELEDLDGIKEYAQYDHFYVANESQHYQLTIDGYSGTAGNAMQYSKKFNHDQKYFSTADRDNDQYSSGNCGAFYSSGWWFDACMAANLNGKYYQKKYKGVRNGIFWGTWHNISTESYPTIERQAFKSVRMMIRPRTGFV